MAYTLKELGSPELASMYQEYLRLSGLLEQGDMDQLEALRRVEQLEVVDNYQATWTVDPNSATFVMVDANGVRTTDADPRMFQPADPNQTTDLGIIPEFEYKPNLAEEPISFARQKTVWWKKLLAGFGLIALLLVMFLAGFVTHNQIAPEPTAPVAEERPVVDGSGPSSERMQQVFTQLSSGDSAEVKYVVPNETNDDMLRWATTVLGALQSDGYRFQETRTEEGVSVLQVLNKSDHVVLQGDLTWVQDAGGTWVLDEVPVMGPVDSDVSVAPVESPTAKPSDGGGDTKSPAATTPDKEPTEKASSEPTKKPTGKSSSDKDE